MSVIKKKKTSLWFYCAALPGSCCLLLIWDHQFALMLMHPLRRGPSFSEASCPSGPGSVPQTRSPSTSQLALCPRSAQWLCCRTSLYSATTKLKDGGNGESHSEMNLFWDSLREFCAAEQGEILIKIPSVIWDDSLCSWEQSGKHSPLSNRFSWIFAFWLFQFTISGCVFTEVSQFTIINWQTVNSIYLIEHVWNWIGQSVQQYIGT